jgi:hypothetical protein
MFVFKSLYNIRRKNGYKSNAGSQQLTLFNK